MAGGGVTIRTRGVVSGRRGRFSRTVSGISKPEDEEENEGQENQTERKAGALAEISRDAEQDKNADDNIYERDKIEQKPPPLLAGYFDQAVKIKDGNDASPTRLSSFVKNLPHADDNDEAQDQADQERQTKNEKACGGGYGGISGLGHNVLVMLQSLSLARAKDILSKNISWADLGSL
jgi:hypothetical protein